jgi:hypothetical protein
MTQQEGLEQRAILVSFSARSWTGEAPDKKSARAIAEKHGNAAGTTRTTKTLVDPVELKKNSKAGNAAYMFYRENTLPWEERRGGARLLPGANYDRFKTGLDELIKAAEERAEEFSVIYPRLVEDYRPQLNGLYDPANYPDPERIREEFSITVNYSPLPISPGSLVLKFLGRAELETLKEQIGGTWETQERKATGDLYQRLAEAVGHMADKLSTPDAVFRDSLVTNLTDLCDLIPALNFSGNPELAKLAEATRAKLAGIDPQKLRDDLKVRGQIATEAGALLREITGAGSRFIDLS